MDVFFSSSFLFFFSTVAFIRDSSHEPYLENRPRLSTLRHLWKLQMNDLFQGSYLDLEYLYLFYNMTKLTNKRRADNR